MEMKRHLETDLGIAAYFLATNAVPFVGLERIGKGRFAFVFDAIHADVNQLVNGYFSGDINASAKAVVDSIKRLKDLMFAERRNDGDETYGQRIRQRA